MLPIIIYDSKKFLYSALISGRWEVADFWVNFRLCAIAHSVEFKTKICDFGLARSIAGVESASLIINSSKRFGAKDEEMKTDKDHEDVVFKHTEPAKLHH